MSNVENCRKCGKIYNYVSGPHICPQCRQAQEEDFVKARDYIRANPNTNVATVAEACEIEVGLIRQWLREERLVFGTIEGSDLTCENCGTKILSGRFCEKCKQDVARGLGNAIAKPEMPKPEPKKKTSDGNKMRFLK